MYAMRKSDLKTFTPRTQDICRIEEGNTNKYLEDQRAIERLLAYVEPRFNESVGMLINDVPRSEHVFSIAGLIGYFLTCSPAALRINVGPIHSMLMETARTLDQSGVFPPPPESLGTGGLADMLDDGRVEMRVDPLYPSAIGITNIMSHVSIFGNSKWDLLKNYNEGCEFFSSDYPVAIEQTPDPLVISRLVPLTPNIAIRITPDIAQQGAPLDFKFTRFRCRKIEIDVREAKRINQLIVRCAEDLVLSPDWREWRQRFVSNHRNYRVDNISQTIPTGERSVIHSHTDIVPHKYS